MPISFSRPSRITSSRGNSEKPKVASDALGNIYVAFQDDRVRQNFPDVYLSKFDSSTGDWLSSNNAYEDIKFENYITKATNPAVAFDAVGNVAVACETEKDGSQSQVQLSVYDGSLITIDENAAAIFPFNDAEGTTTVKNQRRTFRRSPDGSVVTLHIDAVSSKNASDLSDNVSISDGISLANPVDLKAFKLDSDDEWVKIQTSLLKPSGGIDFWMKPILASSDTTTKYFVGNTSLALDPANSFCFMSDNGDLKFKIVDAIGKVHLVTVDSLDYTWAAGEWVHVRLTWDERGKGVTRNTGVSFPSSSVGYVSSLGGGIFKTTDSGTTWAKQNSATDFDLHAIDFLDATTGFACGENGLFLRTDNGGTNWQTIDTGFSEDILALVAADANKIAIAGSDGLIAVTIDGGATWTRATLDVSTDGDFNAIAIVPAGIDWRIIAVGQGGQIYRSLGTVSFSSSFEQMTSPTEEDLFGLSRSHPPGIPATAWTVYAVGAKSTILVSTDKGTTFSASQIEFEGSYPDLLTVAHESNQDNVYAAGSNGATARSLDGADSWATAPSAFNGGDIYGLDASYASTEFSAVGSSGSFLRATGSGTNQVYTTTFSGNMNILINGKLPTQVRTGDSEFRWNPEAQSFFYVGNFEPSGAATQTTTAQASFATLILYRMPPSIGSFTRRQLHTFQSVSLSISADRDLRKRIEFGNISGLAKGRSHWSQVRFFTCGSMEPHQTFSWNALSGLVDDVINDMAIGDGGRLWIATENGVSSFDAKMASDEIGRFVNNQKLYSNNNYRFISYGAESGLPTGSISCIATGSDGSVWVGTRSGIYVSFTDSESTSSAANIDPLTRAAQTAASNDLLGAFDRPAPRAFFKLSANDGSVPERILCATRGRAAMFFGSEDGLYTLTPTGLRRFGVVDGLPSNRVQAVVQDKLGTIWIGTDRGVARYTAAGIVSYGLASSNVLSLYAYKNSNTILAGTLFGIIVIGETEISRLIQTSGNATLQSIFDIDTDDVGRFWLATASGLTEIDPDCYTLPRRYDFEDGILGFPCLEEFKRYKILGGEIPASDYCDRALILVAVNGKVVNEGYKITLVPSSGENLDHINYVEFDNPLRASDKVEVVVNIGIRKIADFDTVDGGLAVVVSDKTTFNLYKRLYTAGDVVFGGNRASGTTNNSAAMYGVFVVSTAGGAAIGDIDTPENTEYRSVVDKALGMYATEGDDAIAILPNFLLSAEQIALSDDDQDSTSDSYLSFELTQSAIVYVAFDSRAKTLPEWLSDFEPVKATLRVNDLEVFEDAELDKLMIAVGGTNGCVYEAIAADFGICDISRSIAIDAEPPVGCATIITANSLESLSLSIEASDSVTGVSEMRVSSNQSFTDENGDDLPWIPFQSSYTLTLPANTGSPTEDVTDLPEDISDVGGEFSVIALFGSRVLVGTSNPGNVYELNTGTSALTLLFETGEDEVLSLVGFGEVLMVGTGINGKAYTWTENDGLVQVSSGEDKVEAMIVFNNKVLIGTSPLAKIYQYDAAGNTSLFLNLGAGGSGDVGISGFAIHGSRLYITTYNDRVTVGETLSTTTAKGHRHTIAVPSGALRLEDIGGVYTSEVATSAIAAHRHLSTAGVLSTESSHTHILNGNRAGKIYEYDLVNDLTKIVHADKDFSVSSIVSTSVSTSDGLMFAGTSPNGKLIRFVPEENIFLLSFDTLASDVSSLIYGTDGKVYATANNVVYKFDGRRWLFIGAADGQVVGSVMLNGIIYMLKTDGISIIKPDAVIADTDESGAQGLTTKLCAFIQLRDAAGNASKVDTNPDCYNPCIEVDANTGTPGGGDDGDGTTAPKFKSHRLVEIDTDANVQFSTNGSEAFFSGDKVQAEIGTYYSEVINGTNNLVQWVGVTWSGTTPTGSEITLAVRTAATSAALATAEWSEEFTSSLGNDITNMLGQFLQFRATLKVTLAGGQSPELHYVDIEARVGQATHYYTTNFVLPDEFKKGILTYNGCINPPITDVVFGVSGLDTTDFADYFVISPNRLFEVPEEHQTKNLRVGIKLISSPDSVPVVDEFALLFSMANNAFTRLMLPGQPGETDGTPVYQGTTRSVVTEKVQGHSHTVTFDSTTSDISQINGKTSINAGHSHVIINGVVQEAAGHIHTFSIE